jgi:hypothetical protein
VDGHESCIRPSMAITAHAVRDVRTSRSAALRPGSP